MAQSPPLQLSLSALDAGGVIRGNIAAVTFYRAETGFSVLKVHDRQGNVAVVVGVADAPLEGMSLEAEGEWATDPQRGSQFKATMIRLALPDSLQGIERYLSSGLVKGIGPKTAGALCARFGVHTLEVIQNCPEEAAGISGLTKERLAELSAALRLKNDTQAIQVLLTTHRIPGAETKARKILKAFGSEALTKVRKNPYVLAQLVTGFGFSTADSLAIGLGLSPASEARAEAALLHALHEGAEHGHCGLPVNEWMDRARTLAPEASSQMEGRIRDLKHRGRVIEEFDLFFDSELWGIEHAVSLHLRKLATLPLTAPALVQNAVERALELAGFPLTQPQVQALTASLTHPLTVLTGGPGVGKTTALSAIVHGLDQMGVRVGLAAPTGKAAKRLSQSTGRTATTLHRLLGFRGNGWTHGPENPLPYDYVIVDEMSMTDLRLFHRLLDALAKSSRLILVGDEDQLPSIGPGRVLADVIQSGVAVTTALREIQRQAAGSMIIRNAHAINRGALPDLSTPPRDMRTDFYWIDCAQENIPAMLSKILTRRLPEAFGFDPVRDVQVLVPKHDGPSGTKELNRSLQALFVSQNQPSITKGANSFRIGDKVIQTRNNYDRGVFNGEVGYVIQIGPGGVIIDYPETKSTYTPGELDEVQHAFAYSIHRSQGSEYPVVILPIIPAFGYFYSRALLYTGLTRAKKLAILIGDRETLQRAVRSASGARRWTGLAQRLSAVSSRK